jgi:hypothetical protein
LLSAIRAIASDGFTKSSLNSAPTQRVGCTSSPPMNHLRVAIGTIRSVPAKTAEIRNASDSVPKIANRSALNIGNTPNLSVAVDTGEKNPARPRWPTGS